MLLNLLGRGAGECGAGDEDCSQGVSQNIRRPELELSPCAA